MHMSKHNLAMMVLMHLSQLQEGGEEYKEYCELQMTAMGMLDADGNLAQGYAESNMWSVRDGELKPSSRAEIQALVPPECWDVL